jgi:oxygen-independent coproporphyrinogen-3 oxidase
LKVYKNAEMIGFKNINVDLMLGLPNQSLDVLKKSLSNVINLEPEHISIYSLILEEGTKLEKMIGEGKLKMIEEDLERKMYWETKKMLEENGFVHYEISNFAKDKNYISRHNMDCWSQKEYIGFGAGAHSYLEKTRYSNICNIEKYIENIKTGNFGKNKMIHEKQSMEDCEKEFMLLGLRKLEGVSIKEYKEKFAKNPIFVYRKELEKLEKECLIEIDGDYISLSSKGLDFANIVWEEFV